ncbi:MAG: cell envelope integrity protein CreD [Kiritimatiellae bacterium]|nr:cell envelope integrity protein CreD [Kiritimatiellia bacterium]
MPGGISRISASTSFKVITIGLLILILLIPAGMVRSLIREREKRQADVVREISSKWGDAQTVSGPILTLPVKHVMKGEKGSPMTVMQYVHILPDDLQVAGKVRPEVRYRGIYEAVLYNAQTRLTGSFTYPDFKALGVVEKEIQWDRASLSLGISDMKGVRENIRLSLNGAAADVKPGIETPDLLKSGVSAAIPDARKTGKVSFELDLDLNGSVWLGFLPVGKETVVELTSSWADPSFSGTFLPAERKVGPEGFSARWKVLHLNRNYPQAWIGTQHSLNGSSFGVNLVIPAAAYQKTMRTAKYAALFIALTFLAFFLSEVMNRLRIHPFQYLLIGLALVVFYTLLLSIAEHIGFGRGYLISGAATVLLISGYARSVLKKSRLALMVGGVLALLYGYLYILLQLEDYALLLGSAGLFVILALTMYLTRRIDWGNPGQSSAG